MSRSVLGLLLATVACWDYSFVGLERNEQRALSVSVQASQADQVSLSLFASYNEGTDAQGNRERLVDSTLLVLGQLVPPRSVEHGLLRYDWSTTLESAPTASDWLTVRGPVLEGATGLSLSVPVNLRLDPRHVDLVEGDELGFNMAGLPTTTADLALTFGQWSLDMRLTRTNSTFLTLLRQGAVPGSLRVPWDWVKDVVSVGDTINVVMVSFAGYEATELFTQATASSHSRLEWQVRVIARQVP